MPYAFMHPDKEGKQTKGVQEKKGVWHKNCGGNENECGPTKLGP